MRRHYESRVKSFSQIARQRTTERLRGFKEVPTEAVVPKPYRRNDYSTIPSASSVGNVSNVSAPILDEEMQERERLAQLEIERKKKCTAPLYNKGAYQYVATEEQAKDVGK